MNNSRIRWQAANNNTKMVDGKDAASTRNQHGRGTVLPCVDRKEIERTHQRRPWQIDRDRLRHEELDKMAKKIMEAEATKLIAEAYDKVFQNSTVEKENVQMPKEKTFKAMNNKRR